MTHSARSINRKDAGGDVLQDDFCLTAPLLDVRIGLRDLARGLLKLCPALLQVGSHAIE